MFKGSHAIFVDFRFLTDHSQVVFLLWILFVIYVSFLSL